MVPGGKVTKEVKSRLEMKPGWQRLCECRWVATLCESSNLWCLQRDWPVECARFLPPSNLSYDIRKGWYFLRSIFGKLPTVQGSLKFSRRLQMFLQCASLKAHQSTWASSLSKTLPARLPLSLWNLMAKSPFLTIPILASLPWWLWVDVRLESNRHGSWRSGARLTLFSWNSMQECFSWPQKKTLTSILFPITALCFQIVMQGHKKHFHGK